ALTSSGTVGADTSSERRSAPGTRSGLCRAMPTTALPDPGVLVTTTADLATDMSLSMLLRTATRTQHSEAESMPFITELMAGRLDRVAYADFLAQHHAVYVALEAGGRRVRSEDPV